ncbi:MAG: hypothetical protein COS84_00615 [Armatimonadetes bacterium CG07_land_8_20_14_0_80_40_9]|nr:MAG: hypothetical protein COS84_00615 [Armatimonadetes bacterium CG07_land_8_20_14_0_80_40_9]
MKVFIDSKEGEERKEGNLKEALDKIKEELKEKNLVVTKVLVDGKEIPLLQEVVWKERAVSEIEKVEVSSANPRELTIAGVLDSLTILPKINESLREAVRLIQTGSQEKGLNLLAEALEGLNWFNVVIQGVEKVLGIELSSFSIKGVDLLKKREELVEVLRKALSSFQNRDFVNLGDLIEYELAPQIESWLEVIPDLIKEVDKKVS